MLLQLFRAIVQMLITVSIMACLKANPLGPNGSRLMVYMQGRLCKKCIQTLFFYVMVKYLCSLTLINTVVSIAVHIAYELALPLSSINLC